MTETDGRVMGENNVAIVDLLTVLHLPPREMCRSVLRVFSFSESNRNNSDNAVIASAETESIQRLTFSK